jgi:hypothetical protein
MCHQLLPERIISFFVVINRFIRAAVEGPDGLGGVTANDVLVVAVVLGEGFLDDRTNDGFVWSNLSIDCSEFAIPSCLKREHVVDNDCVGDAEGVELKSVDSGVAYFVLLVQEDLLHAAWDFGQGRSS